MEPKIVVNETASDRSGSQRRGSVWDWPDKMAPFGVPLLFTLVALLYAAGSGAALALLEASGLQGVFFIPAGITVAFLIRLPRHRWWVVLMAAAAAELIMDLRGGFSVARSAGFSLANATEPLVGATIVTLMCGPVDLARRKHVLWFIVGAVFAGPAVGAALGAGSDTMITGEAFTTTFLQWWLGDALGVVLIGGVILVWGSSKDRRSIASVGGVGLIIGSAVTTVLFLTLADLPLTFLTLVAVVLAAVLFGSRTTAVTALTIATSVAAVLTFDTGEIIVGLSAGVALVVLKLQIGTFALTGLTLAAEAHERDLAVASAAKSSIEADMLERERQREHDLAVQVQRGLLPGRTPTQPGFDIAMRHQTAGQLLEVGGDWYDVIQLPSGDFGIVVGDIVGHGIDAMTSMGRIRTAFSALAMHSEDPASLLTEVDAFVGGPDGTGYATIFYASVDPGNNIIRYASAGHPPALLLSPGGEARWLDEGQSEPMSGDPTVPRRWTQTTFPQDATLILYTDGLIERRGESLEVGLNRLKALSLTLHELDSGDICSRLIDQLTSERDHDDDALVLVVKADARSAKAFRQTYPAEAGELWQIRSDVGLWSNEQGVPESTSHDLLIAVGEATSNVVRHAYRDRPGVVRVSIETTVGSLNVKISDDGAWLTPPPEGSDPGLGLVLMDGVARDVEIDSGHAGTAVTFSIPVQGA